MNCGRASPPQGRAVRYGPALGNLTPIPPTYPIWDGAYRYAAKPYRLNTLPPKAKGEKQPEKWRLPEKWTIPAKCTCLG